MLSGAVPPELEPFDPARFAPRGPAARAGRQA
jgi:hypothetical protein